jgi:hypothetical protein
MKNCFYMLLFLVLGLALPAVSVYAYGDGGGEGAGGSGGDPMIEIESTSSDPTKPPTGFEPTTPEGAASETTTSSGTDPGKEEEVAELVGEVNQLEETGDEAETAENEDVEGESKDPDGESPSDAEEEGAKPGEETNPLEETAEDGDVDNDGNDTAGGAAPEGKDPGENSPTEDPGDKNSEVATLVDDIDPHGGDKEGNTTGQPKPGQGLIGSQGTLPGTKSATLESISTEKNEDGSVSTWATYSNDTWVETKVNPDGTHEITIMLDSGTIIRPGREYIHTGGSLNPLLDYTITALETAAMAGTAAGWVLTVTPAGALASGGVKTAQAVWVTTTGIQALRAGADAYGQNIDAGASQGEAIYEGTKQAAVNAVVVTKIGKHLGTPYEEAIGSVVTSKTGKVVTEVAVKNYGNYAAHRTTENITGVGPGYTPW